MIIFQLIQTMPQTLYLIRHCQATGQSADAPLTAEGIAQAETLAEFLSQFDIAQIVSSPYTRAVNSIGPLSRLLDLEIKLEDRLIEAPLSTLDHPDWLDKLQSSFANQDLSFEGGESSRVATARAIATVNDALASGKDPTALVTHGRLMTLILNH